MIGGPALPLLGTFILTVDLVSNISPCLISTTTMHQAYMLNFRHKNFSPKGTVSQEGSNLFFHQKNLPSPESYRKAVSIMGPNISVNSKPYSRRLLWVGIKNALSASLHINADTIFDPLLIKRFNYIFIP